LAVQGVKKSQLLGFVHLNGGEQSRTGLGGGKEKENYWQMGEQEETAARKNHFRANL